MAHFSYFNQYLYNCIFRVFEYLFEQKVSRRNSFVPIENKHES